MKCVVPPADIAPLYPELKSGDWQFLALMMALTKSDCREFTKREMAAAEGVSVRVIEKRVERLRAAGLITIRHAHLAEGGPAPARLAVASTRRWRRRPS